MPRVKPIDQTASLIEEYKNIKYFCPHPMCRHLFQDIHNDHKIQEAAHGYTYQCIHCKKHFNRSTYRDKHKCGKPHQVYETLDMTKDKYLEFHIKKLWDKGYSNREIHTITHFSRQLVGQITKKFRDRVIDICTIKEFNKEYLSDLDNKYSLIPWRDLRTHKIRKACRMGCSVSQIAKILKIGNTTIVKAKSGKYIADYSTDKEIILTEEQAEFSREAKDFLKNAEPTITNKKPNRKNRTRITINFENKKVRIYGTGNKKKKILSPHTI